MGSLSARTADKIGAKRLVIGPARYGMRDWLAQRITAIVMAVYTVILLAWLFTAHHFSYAGWVSIFAHPWMKAATFATLLGLFYHAWVGVRDIAMDYFKPLAVRLVFFTFAILWLLACTGYAAHILWRV